MNNSKNPHNWRSIEEIEDIFNFIDREANDAEIDASTKNKLSAACLDASYEYARAIIKLSKLSMHGAAFALIRSLFESYVRGVWLHKCATESDVDKFIRGKDIGKFESIVSSLEKIDGFKIGTLAKVKKKFWKPMNGFTHTGYQQVVRRITSEYIEPNYDEDEILEAINFAGIIGCLTAIAICDIANDRERQNNIFQRMKDNWPQADVA